MNELRFASTCAIFDTLAKFECSVQEKSWSKRHTLDAVKKFLGGEVASYYETKFYRLINLAHCLASGERLEQLERGFPPQKFPTYLAHIFSTEKRICEPFDESKLTNVIQEIKLELQKLTENFVENPAKNYLEIYAFLKNHSSLRCIPAPIRAPINDVSLWDHLKLTAAFATCIWMDGGYKGDDLGKYEFALLSGDADRISVFINESRHLPDLNGRSERIKRAVYEVEKSLSNLLGPECVVYAAGGSFLVLAPKGIVDRAILEMKNTFERVTEAEESGVTMTTTPLLVRGDEIQTDFGSVWRRAQQGMRFEKSERLPPPREAVDEDVQICDVCSVRPWSQEDARAGERLCNGCWELREKGKGVWLNDLRDKNDFVACVRADGDDIGKVLTGKKFKKLGKVSSPSRLSTLSDMIQKTCERELGDIINSFKGKCVFAGGDDLLAFVPGELALETARSIGLKFREEMAGQCTMSVGVAISYYKLPVYYGLEVTNYLLSRAKECGKNRVAFVVAGATGLTEPELEKIARVMTWKQLDVILEAAEFMGKGDVASSQLRNIASIAVRNPQKAEVLVKHLIGKSRISSSDGKKFLFYIDTRLLPEAFLIYNLFRGD